MCAPCKVRGVGGASLARRCGGRGGTGAPAPRQGQVPGLPLPVRRRRVPVLLLRLLRRGHAAHLRKPRLHPVRLGGTPGRLSQASAPQKEGFSRAFGWGVASGIGVPGDGRFQFFSSSSLLPRRSRSVGRCVRPGGRAVTSGAAGPRLGGGDRQGHVCASWQPGEPRSAPPLSPLGRPGIYGPPPPRSAPTTSLRLNLLRDLNCFHRRPGGETGDLGALRNLSLPIDSPLSSEGLWVLVTPGP